MRIDELFDGIRYTMSFTINSLPATKEQMDGLYELTKQIKEEPEHLIQLILPNHDDPREFFIAWQGDGYRLILVFPMDDFDWPNPLLLSGENLSFDEFWEILEGVCMDGCTTDSFSIIEHFHNVTDDVYGKTIHDESVNEESRQYCEKLNELINAYFEDETQENHNKIFIHIYEGMDKNVSLPVSLDVDPENKMAEPYFFEFEDKTNAMFVVLTWYEREVNPTFRWISFKELTSICDETENCEGILLNSNKLNPIFFPLELLHRNPKRAKKFFVKHPCPVCGKTMFPTHSSYEICMVCGWEDDGVQEDDPDFPVGANGMSLNDYKRRYDDGWIPDWLKEWRERETDGENEQEG